MFNKLRGFNSLTSNNKIVMTKNDFIKKLDNIVNRENTYNNHFPKNLCYYDGENISADCGNLIKGLIGNPNIDENYTIGKYSRPDFSTGLGDGNVNQMIEACYKADPNSVSNDMSDISKIPPGALLYYYNGKHAGIYVGNGKVIESTPIGERGIQYSDISSVRYNGQIVGKRSKNGDGRGYGTKWAKMPGIDYSDSEITPEPDPKQPEDSQKDNIIVTFFVKVIEFIINLLKWRK